MPGSPRLGLRRAIAAITVGIAALALSGCGIVAREIADGDYAETIPQALAESDRGVAGSYAAKALDGFTFYLSVGIDLDDRDFTEDDLAAFLRIILEHNDLPTDAISVSVQDVDGEFFDIEQLAADAAPDVGLFGSSGTTLRVDNAQAREIVLAIWGD